MSRRANRDRRSDWERCIDIASTGNISVMVAAGGTGGHVFPALAIADELKKRLPGAKFVFVGTKGKIESRIVPRRGYALETIWISGFHRSLRPGNLLFPLKVVVSLVQSFFLMKKHAPDLVIGTGGYVCGPVLCAASLLGIPAAVHESNSYPGVTTRMLSHRASIVFIAFDAARRWLKRSDNVVLAGTPTRDVLGSVSRQAGIERFGLDAHKMTVLVVGGSLGASSINRAVRSCAEDLAAAGVQWIWQTGATDADVAREMDGRGLGWVGPFIDAVEYAYAAADIVVCRAGATTLAEITRLGLCAVVVPYPFAAADHQTFNARVLADAHAAVMIKDGDIGTALRGTLESLLRDERRRKEMAQACRTFGMPDAGKRIADELLKLLRDYGRKDIYL